MAFCRFIGTSNPLITSWFHTDVTAVIDVAAPMRPYAYIERMPPPVQLSYWTMAMAQHWMITQTHCSSCSSWPVSRSSSAHRYGATDFPSDMVPGSATSST